MPTLIAAPSLITAAGQPPKKIEEFIGRVNSRTDALSRYTFSTTVIRTTRTAWSDQNDTTNPPKSKT